MKIKKIVILGADGYLGWAASMYFSKKGYNIFSLDNMSKRKFLKKLNLKTLFPNPSLNTRCKIWNKNNISKIKFHNCDLTNYKNFKKIIRNIGEIEAIIHFAEQPSAPFSMMNSFSSNYTITNNILTTNNLINIIRDLKLDTHVVKLGTMGEYGTPNVQIEEGWINLKHKGRKDKFLFPRQANSIYHTSKIMDTDLLWFACRIWKLRVTDLMQGPVYGIDTRDSEFDERLRPCFHYDEIFGTIINRFVVQACANYPLTVYGEGEQKRGYIDIEDSLRCIEASIKNPPNKGKMNIYNQISETLTVNQIANIVMKGAKELGLKVKIKKIINPRIESEKHFYKPVYSNLKKIGAKRNKISNEYIKSFIYKVMKHKDKIDKSIILKNIKW